ncbi:M48 family metalloprotease [Piscinibacterium candidicorallinum]|uniref:M48 family metalloprotease n=2 Tax=Piscinibacterium candidicorallinum TaxID=1793872 RepID=A0ABV7H2I6_9BURK
MAALLAPIGLPMAFGLVALGYPLLYWCLGAAALAFFAWVVRPKLEFDGEVLARDDAPALFSLIDDVRAKLDVPGRLEVRLNDEFNASAGESRGWFGLIGTKRVLTLGIPLLAALDADDLRAVLAHEFGHFSRRHGRLGHWIYRARSGWRQFAALQSEADSILDRAAAWYAAQFLPAFERASFAHCRWCEFEADADAASVVGAASFAQALRRVAVLGSVWTEHIPDLLKNRRAAEPLPPADLLDQFDAQLRSWSGERLDELLIEVASHPPDESDTHPSTAARLAALNQPVGTCVLPEGNAAQLLGGAWTAKAAAFNARWYAAELANWRNEHARFAWADALSAGAPIDEQLIAARAIYGLDPQRGLTRIDELAQQVPQHAELRYLQARTLLDAADREGLVLLEALAREAVAWRVPAFVRGLRFLDQHGSAADRTRWSDWLRQASKAEAEALEHARGRILAGEGRPSGFAPQVRRQLRDGLSDVPGLDAAWLVSVDVELVLGASRADRRLCVHALVVSAQPEAIAAARLNDDELEARFATALAAWLPMSHAAIGMLHFSTEAAVHVRQRKELEL